MEDMKIGVVGAGSWGTALAKLLGEKGYDLDLWVYEEEIKDQIEESRENKIFLPGFLLPETLHPTNDLKKAVEDKDLVVMVVPSHLMRQVAEAMRPYIKKDTVVVTASKGIENKTHKVMTQVLEECLDHIDKNNFVALSGPSFAREVANRAPTVVAAASINQKNAKLVQAVFSSPVFRVYVNHDPVGTQIGGAMKNILAIAAGICDGMEMGYNPRAALITRGLTEMNRLVNRMNGNPLTLMGLSGVGDLLLTCTGALSRNYSLGIQIGQGKKLDDVISEMRMVVEGVKTTRSVYNLSRKMGVELPICHGVYQILFENQDVHQAIESLMTRSLKHELEGVLSEDIDVKTLC